MKIYVTPIALLTLIVFFGQAEGSSLSDLPLNPDEFTTPPAESMPGVLWFWHQTEMTPEVI